MSQTKTITIQGLEFSVGQPFAEGQTITEAEARALNQVRAENIRNNMAKLVKAAKDEEGNVTEDALNELTSAVAAYDAEYVFTIANVSAGARSSDPVEAEAKKMARTLINNKLKAAGRSVTELRKTDAYAQAVETLAASEEIVKLAKKTVATRAAAANASLESIDL